jgi:uncharacterized integral membrane protein
MIRAIILLVMGVMFYLLHKGNDGNLVTITWINETSNPMPLSWVLLYTFLAGALFYALFTLPERFKTWRALRQHRRSLKKMGKSLGNVINNAKSHQ